MSGGEAPPFWWEKPDWRAWALSPVAALYGLAAGGMLERARREAVDAPVLCIGNFTVGGEGKTPVAIALAAEAQRRGLRPGFLSRGHGGSFSGPHLVDTRHDSARLVGDEPLLLAAHAPTVVTRDRAAGAKRLFEEGCDFLVMDDGFQSARIRIDYALIVVDSARGVGNGHVIPAGPLRARLIDQLRHADALLRMGAGSGADGVVRLAARAGKPVFEAAVAPLDAAAFDGLRCLAFAGIGNPAKFFATLEKAGARIEDRKAFPDHHAFSREDVQDLAARADAGGLQLVTTAKDMVRLRSATKEIRAFGEKVRVLEIETVFENPATPAAIIGHTLAAARERRLESATGAR